MKAIERLDKPISRSKGVKTNFWKNIKFSNKKNKTYERNVGLQSGEHQKIWNDSRQAKKQDNERWRYTNPTRRKNILYQRNRKNQRTNGMPREIIKSRGEVIDQKRGIAHLREATGQLIVMLKSMSATVEKITSKFHEF